MDRHIAIDGVVGGDGNHDAEHVGVKLAEEISGGVVTAAESHRVEAGDHLRIFRVQRFLGVQKDLASGTDEPDLGVLVGGQGIQISVQRLQGAFFLIIAAGLAAGDAAGRPGQRGPGRLGEITLDHPGAGRGEKDKACDPEDHIGKDEFFVQGPVHGVRTSNL